MQVEKILQTLENEANLRTLTPLKHEGNFVFKQGKKLLNLAGNDYLALATNSALKKEFLESVREEDLYFSSSSSRSLSGNFEIYEKLENTLKNKLQKEVLLFNSGYQLNSSCIAALASVPHTLFLADRLIHASMIDGLRGANFLRFRHNDMEHLQILLEKNHAKYENIIILSEALFSMDGDLAKLQELVELKKKYKNVLLYIDEAHSVGCFGGGFGLVKELELEVDFLIFTFGKALASMGACMITSKQFKDFFINKARALIYSTALPPINVAFSLFIFEKIASFEKQRIKLKALSEHFKKILRAKELEFLGDYYIISLILKENQKALEVALKLEENGIFAPAIKTPTVPKNSARIRFSLHANLSERELDKIAELL
ncbi:aminotransferase class I/II-fold pyridoxal phosphate-dependent enzyme [Campylobacter upsaliensis]|uniref:aminotransferase class I/II-fold pyridoxal phosphate-dependent enzyme n=1 Tax=Campylobacter upsaliensis TaxID=28080 RepID=UPI0012745C9C|nr:aminotransferase class I/II-fold pyridoxal phosphate-dependent enzyme [Campylobacter upsaliensis]EAI2893551.1 aminotransferase class I/II-fold pyridoxal phosphate-dependent enzyme [Campylobacter upsaliensis]EAI2894797.1 aminotransferase class I/II-fold pyridoxal phosphate-dependent enzyme [Campylobacter upsaliensis]EAI8563721.1 aminotransferase class I/II-fold pyridoxal phosphate-dependent enzyme [Campylobacter upsaliensis]EAJ7018186.1 aminotransferase class I/II-fold pyridoxal phosphate-dep